MDSHDAPQVGDMIFDYDTGFLCTYHLMKDSDDDLAMSDNLYKIQLAQALRMNMDMTRVLAGHDEFDVDTTVKFMKFISDKTKPCYDDRFKDVLKKHPYLKLSRDYIYKNINSTGDDACLHENEYESIEEYYDNIDALISDIVPLLLSYDTFHAFHRCIIDMFSLPNANGVFSDENLRLLETAYSRINTSVDIDTILKT